MDRQPYEQREGGRRGARVPLALAWSACLACVGLAVGGLLLAFLNGRGPVELLVDEETLTITILTVAFSVVGALISSHRPGNAIGWIFCAVGLFQGLANLAYEYATYALVTRPGSVPFGPLMSWIGNWTWAPGLGLVLVFLPLLFPDGRLPSRRWRPVAFFSGAVIALFSVTEGLNPQAEMDLGGVRNPFGLEGQPWIADATNALTVLFLLCILASVLSLILRYKRSWGEERQQIRWLAFAASSAGSGFVIAMISALISFVLVPETRDSTDPLWFRLLFSVVLMSFGGVPIAVGFAVLRYRLYDIDRVINRTLVYGALTAMLVAVYLGGVAATQTTFRVLTGQEELPQLAIVASTLAIAALFDPLRRRVQAFVDRRFYRQKYDARRMLEVFSSRLRDELDLETLGGDLVAVSRETVQPSHVSFWLRAPGRGEPTE